MHDRIERIRELDAEVLVIAHDDPADLRDKLLAGLDLPFPLGIDRDRAAYRSWGLRRAPWWRIWLDPAVWASYAHLITGGERFRGMGVDALQLGGDFVVAPDGTIAYARPQVRDDRPPVGELLAVVSRLRGTG
jgi:peroxiredoxin